MARANRYFRRSKLSEPCFRRVVRCFALDLTATQTAGITGVSVRSVNAVFLRIRQKTALECEKQSPLEGVLERDGPYFGPRRVRGRCGRGAGGKTIVFGLLKRGDQVYTAIVLNASKAALRAVSRGKASLGSVPSDHRTPGANGNKSVPRSRLPCRHVATSCRSPRQPQPAAAGSQPALPYASCLVPSKAPPNTSFIVPNWYRKRRAFQLPD